MGIALCLAAGGGGCAGPALPSGLDQVAESLRTSLPVVSNDIAATCERQNGLLADLPAEEKSSTDIPQNCVGFVAVAQRLRQDESVLINYLDALAKLSSKQPAAYEAKVFANTTALAGYAGLSSNLVTASTAAQQILDSLANLSTHRYRREQIEKLVLRTDPAVQQLTTALRQVITSDYTVLLNKEQISLASYYESPMAARKSERLTLILVQRQYDQDRAALAHRRSLAKAYGEVMNSIADAHARLATDLRNREGRERATTDLAVSIAALQDEVAHLAVAERS